MNTVTRTFPGTPASVGETRRFVGSLFAGTPHLDDALLLISEVAANAVRHTRSGAGGTYAVTVQCRGPRLRVEVQDQGGVGTVPAPRRPSLHEEGGRGMALLDNYAHAWGREVAASGTVVWFEFALEPAQLAA